MALCLHFRHHFTHAAATDASLQQDAKGNRGVAIGVWSGVQPDYADDVRGTEEDRVGRGLWGMAVPSNWGIAYAKMYAKAPGAAASRRLRRGMPLDRRAHSGLVQFC